MNKVKCQHLFGLCAACVGVPEGTCPNPSASLTFLSTRGSSQKKAGDEACSSSRCPPPREPSLRPCQAPRVPVPAAPAAGRFLGASSPLVTNFWFRGHTPAGELQDPDAGSRPSVPKSGPFQERGGQPQQRGQVQSRSTRLANVCFLMIQF